MPRKGTAPARVVMLEIRWMKVTLLPPRLKAKQAPLKLWAVEARESDAPDPATAIRWRLPSSLPVETLPQAIEKVQ